MINKVILIGNLGRDPEVRHFDNGGMVARFSVATNESYRDKNNEWQTVTEWHDVVAWRNLAERAERQLHKGSMVYVEGKLTHRKWTDRDGNDRYSTEVVANTFRLLDRRDQENRGNSGSEFPQESNSYSDMNSGSRTESPSAVMEQAAEDDLPF